MKTQQPVWKLSANLGDVNPFEDFALLYFDETGVYAPELIIAQFCGGRWQVSRVVCDRCHPVGPAGVGSNKYHPTMRDWFSDKLPAVSSYCGADVAGLAEGLCDEDAVSRGLAYRSLVSYFGVYEFDQSPVEMTEDEVRTRFPEAFFAK